MMNYKKTTLLLFIVLIQISIYAQEITTYTTWQKEYIDWCRYMPEQVYYNQDTDTYHKVQEHSAFTKTQLAKIDSMAIAVIKLITKGSELFTKSLEIEISMYEMKPLIFGIHGKGYKYLNQAIKLNQEAIALTEQIHNIKNEIAYQSSMSPLIKTMKYNIQRYKVQLRRLEAFKKRRNQEARKNKQ